MKATKLISTLVLFLVTSTMFAQHPNNQKDFHPAPPQIPSVEQISKMIEHMTEEIALSASQKKSMLDLHIQHFKKVKEKMGSNNLPDRHEMDELKTEFKKSVKALLTQEQQKGYDSFMEKLHARKPKRQ